MRKSWRVCVNRDADVVEVRKLLRNYGFFALQPTNVTRMEERNGLLCHCDEELCFVSMGPEEIPDGMLDEPLINAILPSPEVSCA